MCSTVSRFVRRIGARPSPAAALDPSRYARVNDQRPASSTPSSAVRRWRRPAPETLRVSATASAARASRRSCRTSRGRARPARPAHPRPACAATACRRRFHRRTTRRAPAGNRRPPARASSAAPAPWRPDGAARVHTRELRRGSSVTGVVRITFALPARAVRVGGVRRVHTARPDRHRSSSQVNS